MTSVRCECGCGWEGEDDVTQFCVEEAVMERLEWSERLSKRGHVEAGEGLSPHEEQQAAHEALLRQARGGM